MDPINNRESNKNFLLIVKTNKHPLINDIVKFVFPYLKSLESNNLFYINRNFYQITKNLISEKKITDFFSYKLTYFLPDKADPQAQFRYLETSIDNCYKKLNIVKTEEISNFVQNQTVNYFLRENSKINSELTLFALKMYTKNTFNKYSHIQLLKILKFIPQDNVIREEIISYIFDFYTLDPYSENNLFFKDIFIYFLLDDRNYDKALNLALHHKDTNVEGSIVNKVVTKLFAQRQENLAIKFIHKNFNKSEYFYIMPNLFLSRDLIDLTLSYAKKIKSLHNEFTPKLSTDRYNYILKLIINHLNEKKRFQEALEIALLLETQDTREKYLTRIFLKNFIEGSDKLNKEIFSFIELKYYKQEIEREILKHVISNDILKIPTLNFLSEILIKNNLNSLKKLVPDFIETCCFLKISDLSKYNEFFTDRNILQKNSVLSFIYSSFINYYLNCEKIMFAELLVICIPEISGLHDQKSYEAHNIITYLVNKNRLEDALDFLPNVTTDIHLTPTLENIFSGNDPKFIKNVAISIKNLNFVKQLLNESLVDKAISFLPKIFIVKYLDEALELFRPLINSKNDVYLKIIKTFVNAKLLENIIPFLSSIKNCNDNLKDPYAIYLQNKT